MPAVIVRRSGRQVGCVRDARIARETHAAHRALIDALDREYQKAYQQWRNGPMGTPAPAYPQSPPISLPKGWKQLGEGSYRAAYKAPSGVVYKVNHKLRDGVRTYGNNYAEMMNIISLRKTGAIPKGWDVPDATLYRVTPIISRKHDYVIAMPMVDTSAPFNSCDWYGCSCKTTKGNQRVGGRCTDDILADANHVFRDLHYGNAFPNKKGVVVVLDVGL